MWKRMGLAVGCAVALVGWSQTAKAEDQTHDGFYLRLGLNFGAMMTTASADVGGDTDFSGFHYGSDLQLGGTPADGLVIGGFLTASQTSDPSVETDAGEGELDGTMIFAAIGVFANYYFDPTQGLHLQGLLGFAALDFVTDEGTSGGNDPTGFMFGLGVGYDFWIGGEWSIGPFGRIVYAPLSAESNNVSVDYTYLNPSIGVAFTYH